MIGIESLMDCLYTSFGRIRSRLSSRGWTYPKSRADDWDRVFDGLPTYPLLEGSGPDVVQEVGPIQRSFR
jgi:hypothetical protein